MTVWNSILSRTFSLCIQARIFRAYFLRIAISAFLCPLAFATEYGGSNYLPGFYGDFGMAVMPDKGTFLNNFFAAYKDRRGDFPMFVEMPGILHVTESNFFGGRYIAGFYPGILGVEDRSGSRVPSRLGLGDFYLIPGALNWKWDSLAALAYVGVVAPTGHYRVGDLNSGRNQWTFDHVLSLTWNLPAANEISLTLGYMRNLKNPATHYRSGDEFHFDYLVGHYLRDDLAFGVAGSWYRQVSADHAPADVGTYPFGEAASIGPTLLYAPRIGGQDVTLSLKWLHEYNVHGRLAGDYLVWRAFLEF